MPTGNLSARAKQVARIDWPSPHPQPAARALVMATILSVGASLVADTLLVWLGTTAFPATKGYGHFHFSDYASLTVIGVVAACAAWPVVTRISPAPRWLFLRLAVVVTLLLWLPDVYLLAMGEPSRAVAVLMVMHLAIALITYNVLVRVAPAGDGATRGAATVAPEPSPATVAPEPSPAPASPPGERARAGPSTERPQVDRLASVLAASVALELVLGLATLTLVPLGRPSGWLPSAGRAVYLLHSILGLPLALGAVTLLVWTRGADRIHRLSGWIGACGVALAGLGGLLAVAHPLRLLGVALMLVGPVVAGFGYLIPLFENA